MGIWHSDAFYNWFIAKIYFICCCRGFPYQFQRLKIFSNFIRPWPHIIDVAGAKRFLLLVQILFYYSQFLYLFVENTTKYDESVTVSNLGIPAVSMTPPGVTTLLAYSPTHKQQFVEYTRWLVSLWRYHASSFSAKGSMTHRSFRP